MSDSELKYLHLLLFRCFLVHLRKRTKLCQFRYAVTQLQLLMATSGNCVNCGSYVIWFVIVKLQTDDLAMAAENSLRSKNQRYKIKQTSSHAVKILFLTFTCEDLGVAMVTNMISQLQGLSAQASGRFFWNFIHKMASRCKDGTVTGDFLDELPNFHIDTFSEREEHSGRFAEVGKWKKLSSM